MNMKELGIYTSLRNTPEQYRITDDGTKFYTLMYNQLVCFEGEGIDKMTSEQLAAFIRRSAQDFEALMHY